MTDDLIRKALVETPPYQRKEIVQRISQQGRKIFGILVLLGLSSRVTDFIESRQLYDERLPFRQDVLIQDVGLAEDEASDFHERQWELTAPVFSHGTLHQNVADNTVMPFVVDKEIGQGSFGHVYQVSIDLDHQGHDGLFPRTFVRKEFKVDSSLTANRSALSHRKELQNLAILSHLNHPNIVKLLGSYTYNTKHNLLFEIATDGNLAGLLAAPRPAQFASDEMLALALARLSSAIEHVHDYSERKIDLSLVGCHHDLRPRNILVCGPNFILADFGLSTFKQPSQDSATPFKPASDDYIAPECEDWDNMFKAGIVHRSSDIWSFGCIIAEIATYMAGGCNGVEAFRQARVKKVRGFVLCSFHEGCNRSVAVDDWLTRLEASPSSSRICTLLVLLARRLLQMEHSKRPNAKEVTLYLRRAALNSVASSVQDLFSRLKETTDSTGLLVESVNFESWRYVMGIVDVNDAVKPHSLRAYDMMSSFEVIVDILSALRKDLESRLSRTEKTRRLNMPELLRLNDDLRRFLDLEQQERFLEYFNITLMEIDCEVFRPSHDAHTSLLLENEVRMRTAIRYINTLLDDGSISESRMMHVELSQVQVGQRFGQHHLAQFKGDGQLPRPVWVEWRTYGQHGADEKTLEQLYGRTARVAELLSHTKPATFRTLDCCGFFHDPTRLAFGLVFDFPGAALRSKPMTLLQIIHETAGRRSRWPVLDDKFCLAMSLATSLLELHTVGWFHKGLTPSNVIFFPDPAAQCPSWSIQQPFVVGFNHSRADEHLTVTTGLTESSSKDYQHPSYIKEGFGYRHEFDYYSLGVILMEIGFWHPFSELISGTKYENMSYEQRRQSLLNDRVPLLKQCMGNEFCEAVRWCIEGKIGHSREKAVLLAFQDQVVRRLRGCFAPSSIPT
ncbi:kinase-like domain-containing protein [Aspergillus stella-maris]|uniref:kinase-like domain-containing protein n=1 Tax=Aspergillus stella-maris TaxID=1810926 RepID=UPI003CCE4778